MAIRITAKKDGFRRCGIAHPAIATEYPVDQFSKKDLVALQAEPMLVVEILPDKPEDKGKDPVGKKVDPGGADNKK